MSTPLLVGWRQLLTLDPFAPIVAAGGRDRVTAVTRVGPLPEERLTLRVAVASGFPSDLVNCEAVDVTLCVDTASSRSGLTVPQSVTFDPRDRRSATVDLAFRRGTGQSYRARLTLVLDGEELHLPWFDSSKRYLHLGPADTPLRLLTVRASAALLAQAGLSVAVTGTPYTLALTPDRPSASLLLHADGDHDLVVTARDPAGAGPALRLALPGRSADLDLWSFPDYGPQAVPVHVTFAAGVSEARYEFRPDAADASTILDFTLEQPSATFAYVAGRLFDNRYRYRRLPAETGSAWSDGQAPGVDLQLFAAATHDTGR